MFEHRQRAVHPTQSKQKIRKKLPHQPKQRLKFELKLQTKSSQFKNINPLPEDR